MSDQPSNEINMTAGVSAFTGEPFIHIQWGELHGQLTPEQATEHARSVMRCVEAALTDAFLFKFMKERVGASEKNAARMLLEFRAYRAGRPPATEIPEEER